MSDVVASGEGFLRVSAGTPAQGVAQAIAHAIEEKGEVALRAIGAGAVNQAIKGLTIARGYIAQRGDDLWYSSGFTNVPGKDGSDISAMTFRAQLKK